MGDDSTPRQVLSISTGMDKMYKIKQEIGEDYICNSVHILSLYYDNGEISYPIDMEIKDYLKKLSSCLATANEILSNTCLNIKRLFEFL